jgi:hypothetical protein
LCSDNRSGDGGHPRHADQHPDGKPTQ